MGYGLKMLSNAKWRLGDKELKVKSCQKPDYSARMRVPTHQCDIYPKRAKFSVNPGEVEVVKNLVSSFSARMRVSTHQCDRCPKRTKFNVK
jgi:hypothetical protein